MQTPLPLDQPAPTVSGFLRSARARPQQVPPVQDGTALVATPPGGGLSGTHARRMTQSRSCESVQQLPPRPITACLQLRAVIKHLAWTAHILQPTLVDTLA